MRSAPHAVRVSALVPLLLLTAAAPTIAQQPNAPTSTRFQVTVLRLKPEMVDQWLSIQRDEVMPAQKKAGLAGRTTLVTAVGNSFEYTIITPFPSFGAMDGDPPLVRALGREGAARVNAKLRPCILTQQTFMTNRQEALQVDPGGAPIWRTTVRRALPGKMPEYLAHMTSGVLPAMQKAKADGKIAGFSVATRGVGAAAGELTTVTYYAKFGDMEGGDPLVLTLGREGASALSAKSNALAPTVTTIVRRRLADLSF